MKRAEPLFRLFCGLILLIPVCVISATLAVFKEVAECWDYMKVELNCAWTGEESDDE